MKLISVLSDEIGNAVEQVLPAIVEIKCSARADRLFDRLRRKVNYQNWGGAGVLIRHDGVVLTNHHVVAGATGLCVNLQDGRSFEPELVGDDPVSDIAVLKIPVSDLHRPPFAVDRPVRLGEIVIAVGHPLGFTATITQGIVSASERFSMGPGGPLPRVYIQTDASINPANSGGALVGCDGMVIGIVTWGVVPSEGENLAFAIPIRTALKVAEALLDRGSISYGTIGIYGYEADLPADVVKRHRLTTTALLVTALDANGPASKAGIQHRDWVLSIEGCPTDTVERFLDVIAGHTIGDRVNVRILRGLDYAIAEKHVQIDRLEV